MTDFARRMFEEMFAAAQMQAEEVMRQARSEREAIEATLADLRREERLRQWSEAARRPALERQRAIMGLIAFSLLAVYFIIRR